MIQAAILSIPRGRRKDYKPYWNQRLEDLRKQLDTARDAQEKQPTDFNRQVHKNAKNLYKMEKHSQRQRNWFEKTSSLNMEKDTQKLWQLTKALNDDNVFKSQTMFLTKSGPAAGKAACIVLANACENFSEVEILRSRIHDTQRETKELQNIDIPYHPCMLDRFTMKEFYLASLSIYPKKTPGPDGITNDMLRHIGPAAKKTLLAFFNQSWHLGHVPSRWKEAVVRPILRKGKNKKTYSYRPITLLSCLGKLLLIIVNSRLVWFLESQELFSFTQTGYCQHHSTYNQLTS